MNKVFGYSGSNYYKRERFIFLYESLPDLKDRRINVHCEPTAIV